MKAFAKNQLIVIPFGLEIKDWVLVVAAVVVAIILGLACQFLVCSVTRKPVHMMSRSEEKQDAKSDLQDKYCL